MKLDKAIKIATEVAYESKEKHRIGAVLFDQEKYVSSYNRTFAVKVQNRSTQWSEHAEASVINHALHLGFDLTQSTLVVIRINNKGKLLLAHPCKYCTKLIKKMGVPLTYYSNDPFHRKLSPENFKSLE